MEPFPSLKWPQLKSVLQRRPLRYRIVRQTGSHKTLKSEAGYPDLHLAWHDTVTIAANHVRKILCDDVGLTEEQARKLL